MTPFDLLQCSLDGRRLIEASAGTGKTYTICLLYLRTIIERQHPVREVLVVSFTKAATAELKERIRARLVSTLDHLRGNCQEPLDPGLAQLLAHYREAGRDPLVMQKRLAAAIASFDEAAIHTIHGFCKRIVEDAPFVTGMPLELDLQSDDAPLRSQLATDLYREWLSTTQPSMATVASLWQGKTLRDLDIEMKRCLAKPTARPVWPASTPSVNPAERAARETRYAAARQRWQSERVAILSALNASMQAGALNAGSYKPDRVADAAHQWDTLLQAPTLALARRPKSKKDCKLKLLGLGWIDSKIVGRRQAGLIRHAFFADAQAVLDDLSARDEEAARERLDLFRYVIAKTPERMQTLKRAARMLTFDDLLKALFDQLKSDAGATLAADIRRRFPFALIDEFQDTDPLQYGIFNRVYEDSGTLLLVGDPKQAIYAFRNADLHVYLSARSTASERLTLTHNQRSTGEYLKALNALFGHNPRAFVLPDLHYHQVFDGSKSNKPFHDPAADRAALQLWCLPGGDGEQVWDLREARAAAAAATAAEISRLLRGARAGEVRYDGRPLAAGDMAVLVPTHARGTEVRQALADLGIGAVELSRDSVYATDEARELACILDAILSPNRVGLIRAALATHLLGYTATALHALNADDDALMAEFERFERYRTVWAERGVGVLLRSLLVDFAITERLLTSALGERRLTNLRQLIELLQTAAADHPAPDALRHWLQTEQGEETADEVSQLRLESDRDLVQIVSIHAAKGLEFPIVFCPTLCDDFLNGGKKRRGLAIEYRGDDHQLVIDYGRDEIEAEIKARIDEEVDAERMRLLYVALTRAIHRTYLVVGPWRAASNRKGPSQSGLQWLVAGAEYADYAGFQDSDADATAMREAWVQLASSCADIGFASLPVAPGVPLPPPTLQAETLAARTLSSPLPRARRVGSFSSLVHGASHEIAVKDRDARTEQTEGEREPTPVPADDIRRFPRGARAGECIHAVFEEVDFTNSSGWPSAIRQALALHPPGGRVEDADAQAAMLHAMLTDVLATPLAEELTLQRISPRDRLVEWEFSLPAGRLEAGVLSRLLAQHGYAVPALRFATLEGYLRGFVDLIVRHEGRYYVMDWKSNVLGEEATDYAAPALEAAMVANGYHLQHLLYTVALHRWLGCRLPGYDYDTHMGGTRYLYIRAVRPDWPGAGIYANRPPRALIEALSRLLDPPEERP